MHQKFKLSALKAFKNQMAVSRKHAYFSINMLILFKIYLFISGKNQYKLDNVTSNKTKGNKDCEERMNE